MTDKTQEIINKQKDFMFERDKNVASDNTTCNRYERLFRALEKELSKQSKDTETLDFVLSEIKKNETINKQTPDAATAWMLYTYKKIRDFITTKAIKEKQ